MKPAIAPLVREQVLDLWASGSTSCQIHRALLSQFPGLTRNMVIGVLNRARKHDDPRAERRGGCIIYASGVPTPKLPRQPKGATKPKAKHRRRADLQPPAPPPMPLPPPPPPPRIVPEHIPPRPQPPPPPPPASAYDGLTRIEGGCRWPMCEPDKPGFRYCEAVRVDARAPYCDAHKRLAFSRWRSEAA